MPKPNPWVAAIPILNAEEIRKRVHVKAVALTALQRDSVEDAAKRLDTAIAQIYYPTEQDVALIMELLGVARAHALSTYQSAKQFLEVAYDDPENGNRFTPPAPIILTGPSGSGKSSISRAIERLLQGTFFADVGRNHPKFGIRSAYTLAVRHLTSLPQVRKPLESLRELVPSLATPPAKRGVPRDTDKGKGRSLTEDECRSLLFKVGLCLLFVDETQWVTRSDSANALAATLVSGVADLGPQVVVVMNYSMGHRLLRRPPEEVQRLLSKPRFLLALVAATPDWIETVKEVLAVAPDIFTFDVQEGARVLHTYTAGLRRLLRILLVEAFRLSRRRGREVTLVELRIAYESAAYKANRDHVLIIHRQNASGEMGDQNHRDLWCPFELPVAATNAASEAAQADRLQAIRATFLVSSLTQAERAGYRALQRSGGARTPRMRHASARGSVLSLADALEADALLRRADKGRRPPRPGRSGAR